MSIPKVTFEFAGGMEMLNNLMQQIETALEGRKPQKRNSYEWKGYDIYGKMGWVGNYFDGSKLTFEHHSQKVIDHITKNRILGYEVSENKQYICSFYNFDENRYFCMTALEQLDALKKWIDINCELIEKYGK